MGMFDTIEDELFCPFCGAKNKGFQSKDTGENLTSWTIDEIESMFEREITIEIHDFCYKCKRVISINLRGSFKDDYQKLVAEKLRKIKNGKRIKHKRKEIRIGVKPRGIQKVWKRGINR